MTDNPCPLFDTLTQLETLVKLDQQTHSRQAITNWLESLIPTDKMMPYFEIEYRALAYFLYSFRGSNDTFNSYRRELERFTEWSWFIQQKSLLVLRRDDLESYIDFVKSPPLNWIGTKIVSRFLEKNGERIVNPTWRPFISKINKSAFQDGKRAKKNKFTLSSEALKQLFAILSTFYHYLIQEEIADINPVALIRQKSKYIRKQQGFTPVRRLSLLQWQAVIQTAEQLAIENPSLHERTLFIMHALCDMYLRISELVASERWLPKMSDFFRDANGDWWFKTVGKGNKMRQIAVSNTMLDALKRYRQFLQFTPLPSLDEQTCLLSKSRGNQPIESTRAVRQIVQICFDKTVQQLRDRGEVEEAKLLQAATVHWLRHTGISEDVKIRPREHVRDDAGHSSSAITDRYVDVELKERAKSAKKKRFQANFQTS
jgi:site-specific recombinase XerD